MQYKDFKLSVVIPVYNSQETISQLIDELIELLKSYNFEIILVNDCSMDKSHEICLHKHEAHPDLVRYFKLSRNFGEHNAVIAGLNQASGDYAIIIDDDFQNPPDEIPRMIEYMRKNKFDVLYTFSDEKKHNLFRNIGSWFNNRVAAFLLKIPKNIYLSSFKCINRFLIDEIIKYHGPYPYIDGLILRVTRNIGQLKVNHERRIIGKSNYTFRKLVSLWVNMFVNFSVVPLRLSFFLGSALTFIGFMLIVYFLFDILIFHPEGPWPAGWPSLLVCVITFSGAQLMFLGLIGEYIGKLFLTDNGTPQFVIHESHGNTNAKEDLKS